MMTLHGEPVYVVICQLLPEEYYFYPTLEPQHYEVYL